MSKESMHENSTLYVESIKRQLSTPNLPGATVSSETKIDGLIIGIHLPIDQFNVINPDDAVTQMSHILITTLSEHKINTRTATPIAEFVNSKVPAELVVKAKVEFTEDYPEGKLGFIPYSFKLNEN